MTEEGFAFCDVAVPVPLDRLFTYELPGALQHRVAVGSRVWVPFGPRRLNGVVLRVHNHEPKQPVRLVESLLNEEPVIGPALIELSRWISQYYCSPIGEVLKSMLPLGGETRRSKKYTLTSTGEDVARQLIVRADSDPATTVLALLEGSPRSSEYLSGKVKGAQGALRGLVKRGWVVAEETQDARNLLRTSAARLAVEFAGRPSAEAKLNRSERELLAYLELHPGAHNVAELGEALKRASQAARSLAKRNLIRVAAEDLPHPAGFDRPVPELNRHQQAAFEQIEQALSRRQYRAFLLEGVTGSGKTEVYLRSIESALAYGQGAILLVPEIALTPAMAGQFFHRFGRQVAILHSAFGDSERAEQWRRIRNGQARVAVGTRSAVFAPVQNLGLLIVDEEHDGSYKQGENPRYHGRDVALMRGKQAGAVIVLGSATPSVESRHNADRGKYTRLLLPERVAKRPMPQVEVVDMRLEFLETKRQSTFSRRLSEQMARRLEAGEQTMLLLNRRGYSSFMICRECGERMSCTQCSVVLTQHRRDRRMLCHYCGYADRIPEECAACGSDYIQFLGTGSERVEDELHRLFPEARVARLDRDTAAGKGAFERILQTFRNGEIDILVGTQMIAKGHDIPNVTLVGVVLADIGLSMPDFRAAERSFQLLTQAAGRAGRGDAAGTVVIQTLNPEHYAVRFAAAQDYESFYKKEMEFRKWLRWPPFAACANVLVRAEQQEEALRMATELGHTVTPSPEGIRILGPSEAAVLRLKNEFRYQLLIKAAQRSFLRELLKNMRTFAEARRWKPTALVIDVDPINLL